MKKLVLFFTFLFIFFPLKAFANDSCFIYDSFSINPSYTTLTYVKRGDTSITVTAPNNTPVVADYPKSLTFLYKYFSAPLQGDFIYFTGNIRYLSLNPSGMSTLPSPRLYPNTDLNSFVYCDYSYFDSSKDNYTSLEDSSISPPPVNYLSTYNFTLKCPVKNTWTSSSQTYRLQWDLNYGFNYTSSPYVFYEDKIELLINISFTGVIASDSCSNDEIISSLGDIQNSIIDINDSITDINDTITDTNVSGASSEFEDVLENWSYNDFSLSDFVTAPLNFIRSLANQNVCSPITLPPLLGNTSTFELPCIMETFATEFPSLFTIYQIAIYFFVCYRIGIDLFRTVHKLKDPLNDEISVADI